MKKYTWYIVLFFVFLIFFYVKDYLYSFLLSRDDFLETTVVLESDYQNLKNDYDALVQTNELWDTTSDEFITTKVVLRDPYVFMDKITILKGSEQGITIGDVVINQDGYVGRIVSTWKNSSQVELLTNQNTELSVRIGNSYGILKRENEVIEAVVADPVANEVFTATRGVGAFVNGRRLRVSKRSQMAEALVGTGFPFRRTDDYDAFLKVFKEVAQSTSGLRRAGAASLDLAYVAAGRLDAFWEANLKSWDMSAGSLLVLEAGGLVTDFKGESDYLEKGQIIAGTPKIFGQLLPMVQRNYGDIK